MRPTHMERIQYRDRQRRGWYVSEVARLKVVAASVDGPNLCLVIRFEREGMSGSRAGSAARSGVASGRCIGDVRRAIDRRPRELWGRPQGRLRVYSRNRSLQSPRDALHPANVHGR